MGQLESSYWYFGINSGLKFTENSSEPVFDGRLQTTEGCATISDSEGNLFFYTDGIYVYNRNHQLMPNGIGLKGNPSCTQSGIIDPYPNRSDLYYIFTVGADDFASPEIPSTENTGLNYYLVDMNFEGGLGDVLPFDEDDNNLMPITSEKVTTVAHKNDLFYWVITQYEDK